jgi:hypothetical protein
MCEPVQRRLNKRLKFPVTAQSKNLLKHWRDGFADHLKIAPVLVADLE